MNGAFDKLPSLAGTPWRWLILRRSDPVVCLISAPRYEWVTQWEWNCGWWANTAHKQYAKRNEGVKRTTIYLHREILKLKAPQSKLFYADHHGDHINNQPLDNRDDNLRWATPLENNLNRIIWENVPTLAEIAEDLLASWKTTIWQRERDSLPF